MPWHWIAATSRGSSHEVSGTRLQDAAVCFSPSSRPDVFAVIVSDGAGSTEFGGEGASLICRTLGTEIRTHFRTTAALPSEENVLDWIDHTRDRINSVASRRGRTANDFAGTLVAAISNGAQTTVVHIGDGCVVVRDSQTKTWVAPTWPQSGEFAATTYFLTDNSAPKVRFAIHESAVDVIAAFSDGIERLALDFKAIEPFGKFFDGMAAPLLKKESAGRDRDLSQKLKTFLASPQVLSRTDDDKSLIIATHR